MKTSIDSIMEFTLMNRNSRKRTMFLVEGKQEAQFVKKLVRLNLCDECTVAALEYNGKNISMEAMARKIFEVLTVRDQKNYHFPIVVVFDREGRQQKVEEMIEELKIQLNNCGLDTNKFLIGIPNQSIESWIVPFVDSTGKFPVEPTNQFEGKKCTGKLKERLKKRGGKYSKTDIGVKLLLSIDPVKLASVSESFRLFYNSAKSHCKWLRRTVSIAPNDESTP